MVENLIQFAQELVQKYGIWGIFFSSVLEEVVSFIPASAVQLSSAVFYMGSRPVNPENLFRLFYGVALPISAGLTLASLPYYYGSYYGGEIAIKKYGKYVGVKWEQVEKMVMRFKSGTTDEIAFFILRLIVVIPSVLLHLLAGIIKMRVWTYVWITFTSMLVRTMVVGFVGWQTARKINSITWIRENLDLLSVLAILVVTLGASTWYWQRKIRKRKKQSARELSSP